MKKLIYGSLFLAAIGIGVVGCKKSNAEPVLDGVKTISVEEIRGLEKIGSIMSFETIQDYTDFIEDENQQKWQRLEDYATAQGFQNYFTQNPVSNNSEDDTLEMDSMFGKLLNVDGVVLIGDYAVKIDLPNGAVYVSSRSNLATNYSDLISGNTVNKYIKAFSTDDNVIEYLIDGVTFKCGGSSSFDETHSGTIGDGKGGSLKWNAKYFKAGIYNVVRIYVKHSKNGTWQFDNAFYTSKLKFEVDIAGQNFYQALRVRRRHCGSGTATYHEGGVRSFMGYDGNTLAETRLQFTVYEKAWALNGYRVWIRGHYTNFNNQVETTNWFGRIINANF